MGYSWGHPGGGLWGHDGGWTWAMGMHGIPWLLFLVLAVLGIVLLVRRLWRAAPGGHPHTSGRPGEGALTVLEARYAKGEIGRDEFLEKKQDLAA